jgi:phosphate transport system protein
MTRIVEPFIQDLRQKILQMGGLSEEILKKSMRAVFDRNRELALEVGADDIEIDRFDISIDEAVLRALALQAPVADDLRLVIAIKMMATDLERVGDLSRNIAKCAVRLAAHPEVTIPSKLKDLAFEAQRLLRRALDSFSESDVLSAESVLDDDDQVDDDQDEVVRETILQIAQHPEISSQGIDFILIAKNLERVADHATNIAEEVILWTDGRNLKHVTKLQAEAPGS